MNRKITITALILLLTFNYVRAVKKKEKPFNFDGKKVAIFLEPMVGNCYILTSNAEMAIGVVAGTPGSAFYKLQAKNKGKKLEETAGVQMIEDALLKSIVYSLEKGRPLTTFIPFTYQTILPYAKNKKVDLYEYKKTVFKKLAAVEDIDYFLWVEVDEYGLRNHAPYISLLIKVYDLQTNKKIHTMQYALGLKTNKTELENEMWFEENGKFFLVAINRLGGVIGEYMARDLGKIKK